MNISIFALISPPSKSHMGSVMDSRWMRHIQRVCDAAKRPMVKGLTLSEQEVNIAENIENREQASLLLLVSEQFSNIHSHCCDLLTCLFD